MFCIYILHNYLHVHRSVEVIKIPTHPVSLPKVGCPIYHLFYLYTWLNWFLITFSTSPYSVGLLLNRASLLYFLWWYTKRRVIVWLGQSVRQQRSTLSRPDLVDWFVHFLWAIHFSFGLVFTTTNFSLTCHSFNPSFPPKISNFFSTWNSF